MGVQEAYEPHNSPEVSDSEEVDATTASRVCGGGRECWLSASSVTETEANFDPQEYVKQACLDQGCWYARDSDGKIYVAPPPNNAKLYQTSSTYVSAASSAGYCIPFRMLEDGRLLYTLQTVMMGMVSLV